MNASPDPQQDPRRWWALSALALGGLLVSLDLTVLNVALPSLAVGLKANTSDLQWFANAYNLVFAALMLLAGLLGDRYGRKKLLVAALVVFGLASAGCAFSTSTGELIGARAALGLGAAFMLPLGMAQLPVLFTTEERGRALTIWITANAVGTPIGPIVGGILLDHFWWGSVFLINVPMVVIALVMAVLFLPESSSPSRPRLDIPGVIVSSGGLVALTLGVITAGKDGWGAPAAVGEMVGGGVLLVAFVLYQRALTARLNGQPLIELDLFKSRSFTWGTVLATTITFAMFGVLFAIPQFFQAVDGTNSLGTGLRLLPLVGGMLLGSRTADRITAKAGPKALVAAGFLIIAVGLFVGTTTSVGTGYGTIAIWYTIIGVGFGLALPTSMGAALSALSPERSGVGSALIQALRQVGGTIGVAILGTVLNNGYRSRLDLHWIPGVAANAVRDSAASGVSVARKLASTSLLDSVRIAFTHALDLMLAVGSGIAIAGILVAVAFLPGKPPAVEQPAPSGSGRKPAKV